MDCRGVLGKEAAMGVPARAAQEASEPPGRGWLADLACLGTLVVAAVALRGWQLRHTEVASRDSIGYIRIAWQLEHDPWAHWPETLQHAQQHPGYPLALLAVSQPVRDWLSGDLARQMQISAQLASALASVLLVVPMYFLGRQMFDRRVAFWGTLLFQCLPASGRGMADGLSEPFFLLAMAAALTFAFTALRRSSVWAFGLSGLCGGVAYVTRPEGALVVAATGVVLLAAQRVPAWRRPWRKVLACGLALVVAALAIGWPYAWAIGGLTVKHTALEVLHTVDWQPGGTVLGPPLAVWWPDNNGVPAERTWWGFVTVLEVLSRAFFYVVWVPALVGLWWFRDLFRRVPGTWVLVALCLPLLALLYCVARKLGYLSDRHTLVILLSGIYFAAAGLRRMGEWLGGVAVRLRPAWQGTRWARPEVRITAVLLLCCLGPLPRTLEKLHADRSGFRAAGYWLAGHTLPGDSVVDPYCWANYYAGRVFTEGLSGLARTVPPIFYMVVEEAPSKHTRLEGHNGAMLMRQFGTEINRFAVKRGKERAAVVVYRMHGTWAPPHR
jgi:hypothetical protein